MRRTHAWLPAAASLILMAGLAASAQLPASKGAPKVGEKMPDFTLPDTSGKAVRLYDLMATPLEGSSEKKGSWVLLVFYRGYW